MHAIGTLPNAVRLQQMVEQVLAGFEVFSTNGTGHPLGRGRVNVSHVLLEIADGAVAAAALFAERFWLSHGAAADVGATTAAAGADADAGMVGAAGAHATTSSSTSCNPTTARYHSGYICQSSFA